MKIELIRDNDPENPRDFDNQCRMICWHNRHTLGDDHLYDRNNYKWQIAFEHNSDLDRYVYRCESELYLKYYDYARNKGFSKCHEYASSMIHPRLNRLVEEEFDKHYVALTLYLYDHSGLSIKARPFGCNWDSGPVGHIICPIEHDNAEEIMLAEIKTYDQYLQGDVWGYRITRDSKEEDSCWGFFGSNPKENGMLAYWEDSLTKEELAQALNDVAKA